MVLVIITNSRDLLLLLPALLLRLLILGLLACMIMFVSKVVRNSAVEGSMRTSVRATAVGKARKPSQKAPNFICN